MKLPLLILIAAMLPCFAFAQDAKNPADFKPIDIGIGGGYLSSDYLFDGYTIGRGKLYTNRNYSGTFFFNFKYFVVERFAINITVAYENESGLLLRKYNEDRFGFSTERIGIFRRQAFTVSPEIAFYYYKKGLVWIYGTFGMGLTYRNEIDRYDQNFYNQNYWNGTNKLANEIEVDNSKVQGNAYLSPIGLSVGRRVRWYAEIGLGYKGVANSGISFKF